MFLLNNIYHIVSIGSIDTKLWYRYVVLQGISGQLVVDWVVKVRIEKPQCTSSQEYRIEGLHEQLSYNPVIPGIHSLKLT